MGSTARLSFIALVCALAASISSGQQVSDVGNRIFGGDPAIPGEFPFMAALEQLNVTSYEWKFRCGGSIIGQSYILTAAHCVKDRGPEDIRVKLGCHLRSECNNVYGLREIIVHPEYIPMRNNDIAILKLDRPISFNQAAGLGSIGKIRLNEKLPRDEGWGNLTVIGWGRTFREQVKGSDVLMKVHIRANPFAECNNEFRSIGNNEMCAGGNGLAPCRGDSGGPLFKTLDDGARLQVGVVSRGNCVSDGVFARVASHYSWIMENTLS